MFNWLKKQRSWFLAVMGVFAAGIGLLAWNGSRPDPNEATFASWARVWTPPVRLENKLGASKSLLEIAEKAWNDAVGCEIFRVVPDGEPADVKVSWWEDNFAGPCGLKDVKFEKGKQGSTFFRGECWEVYLKSPNGLDEFYMQRVVAHELGHVVGLDHDRGGLMSTTIYPLAPIKPSKRDIQVLQERYCR